VLVSSSGKEADLEALFEMIGAEFPRDFDTNVEIIITVEYLDQL
jgi:hypothetical protein